MRTNKSLKVRIYIAIACILTLQANISLAECATSYINTKTKSIWNGSNAFCTFNGTVNSAISDDLQSEADWHCNIWNYCSLREPCEGHYERYTLEAIDGPSKISNSCVWKFKYKIYCTKRTASTNCPTKQLTTQPGTQTTSKACIATEPVCPPSSVLEAWTQKINSLTGANSSLPSGGY